MMTPVEQSIIPSVTMVEADGVRYAPVGEPPADARVSKDWHNPFLPASLIGCLSPPGSVWAGGHRSALTVGTRVGMYRKA